MPMQKRKKLFLTAAAVVALCIFATGFFVLSPPAPKVTAGELKTFSSEEELARYIQTYMELSRQFDYFFGGAPRTAAPRITETPLRMTQKMAEDTVQGTGAAQPEAAPTAKSAQPAAGSPPADYSSTNVQVEGVDEGDIVKSDGQYLYVLSGNKAAIVEAYPAEKARLVSEIAYAGSPREAFINKNKLVVFGAQPGYGETFIRVYDTADKEKPVLKRDVSCRGNYVTSRMIGDYVYVIINAPVIVRTNGPQQKQKAENQTAPGQKAEQKIELPQLTVDGRTQTVLPAEIHYFDYPDRSYCYTMILSFNTQNDEVKSKTFLTGISQNVYASAQNIYLTGIKAPDFRSLAAGLLEELAGLVPPEIREKFVRLQNSGQDPAQLVQEAVNICEDYLSTLDERESAALAEKILAAREKWQMEIARQRDRTAIHKLAAANGEVTYRCSGDVPGQVLNQFSMDEYKGMFRIATTSQGLLGNWQPNTRNNIYVLDEGLQIIGRLQGLAPAEQIYAARFMGERAYLVTFRRIDPLFVIDLKDPAQPKVLGELKIPGYSDYLHPYDENYLIGIGKEVPGEIVPLSAPADSSAQVQIWPPPRETGIKIALFDVRDPARPKEAAKYVIPGENADSPALRDHKAVLFSREKHLLAIPVSFAPVYRIMSRPEIARPQPGAAAPEVIAPPPRRPRSDFWHGVYVFDLSPENGLRLKGKITLSEAGSVQEKTAGPAKRSLYINEVLYTVSDRLIKMNDLGTLKEINEVWLD